MALTAFGPMKSKEGSQRRWQKPVKSSDKTCFMAGPTSWDDKGFQKAFRVYLDLRKNVDPNKELRRRAKNIGLRLINIYKDKGVDLDAITQKVNSLGNRVKIRPKIRLKGKLKGKSHKQMIAAELRARRSSKGFAATGWFPSVKALGGSPRDKGTRTAPQRGKLEEKLTGNNISETLVNQQPGSGYVMNKTKSDCQKALDDETADLVKYITRKQNEAAKKAGLA